MAGSAKAFLKCTRWQVEETTDLLNCPYHYFCASSYPGDYPPLVDVFVFIFAVASILSATVFTLSEFRVTATGLPVVRSSKERLLLPSGPIGFPLTLLILANGSRINTMFPLTHLGPALLQLVHVSALAFRNRPEDVNYAVLEASTVSGILHAGLYLDSIMLPYYTGLEALTESTFSGVCASCVCRKNVLVAGGGHMPFRGWSMTTFCIASALCSRMTCRILGKRKLVLSFKLMLEACSWVLLGFDSIHLLAGVASQGTAINVSVYGGLCVLVLLNVLRETVRLLIWLAPKHRTDKMSSSCQLDVGVA